MIKDILYISGTNKESQANWEHLLHFYPAAHCLNGQATINILLQQCREHIHDDFFLVVSSATRLLRPLDGDLPQRLKDQTGYLWQGDNSINRSQWSFAGPVLLPAKVVDHQFNPLFPTLSPRLRETQRIPQKAFLYLNSDSAQNAWKTGFCEGLSLTCHLKNNDCPEFRMLLDMWCRDNAAQGFSPWANRGARYGREFGSLYVDPELTLLNAVDDAWLENEFHLEERLFPVQPLMCQEPRPDEYASFDTALYPTSNKSLYVSTLTNQSRLLTQELAALCSFCADFKTLDQHMENYFRAQTHHFFDSLERKTLHNITSSLISSIRRQADKEGMGIPVSAKKKHDLRDKLTNLILQGCLVSDHTIKRELLRRMLDNVHREPESPALISSLGMPTKDRPLLLAPSLESFVKNACEYGHKTTFTIVDDSEEPANRQLNRTTLIRLRSQYQSNLVYISRDDRRQYAQRLHQHSGIPLQTVLFCLLGVDDIRIKMGAVRNTLQLKTLGELNLQMDDDTICRLAFAEKDSQGRALTSKNEAKAVFFKDDRFIDAMETRSIDWIQLHESHLGKRVFSEDILNQNVCFETQCDISGLYPTTFLRLTQNDCRTHVTMLGSFGDSGEGNGSHRLLLRGESFRQLTAEPSDYEQLLCSRYVFKSVKQLSLTDSPGLMAMNIGFDNRVTSFPFSPVFRNEDAVFGNLLRFCSKNALIAHIPCAIQHRPQPRRLPSSVEELINGAAGWGFNDFINAQIVRCPFNSGDVYRNIRMVGECLQEIAEESEKPYASFVFDLYRQEILQKLQVVRNRREEHEASAPHWTADILRLENSLEKSLVASAPPILQDIPGSMTERMCRSRTLLFEMGALFYYWPEIVSAAQDLKAQGIYPGHVPAS